MPAYHIEVALGNTVREALDQIQITIKQRLREGFVPVGGVSIARDSNGTLNAMQVMFKQN